MCLGGFRFGSSLELDLTSLKKAISSFEEAIEMYTEFKCTLKEKQLNVIKTAVIKNFEFTYELSWKFLKKYIEMNGSGGVALTNKRELFRISAEHG